MRLTSLARRRFAAVLTTAAAVTALSGFAAAGPAQAACADVEFIFARGSGELPGLGISGGPTFDTLKKELRGLNVTSYGVNWTADWSQMLAHFGADDLVNRVAKRSKECPDMKFVIGGYSQGATVVGLASGMAQAALVGGGPSKTLNQEQADRIVAAVTFGPAPWLMGGKLKDNKFFRNKSKEFCAFGDPVCANGVNVLAHIQYPLDGSTTKAGKFAAEQVRAALGS